ncbi:MAG TPA: ribonuclease HI [Candidatus Nanoarchaeia archaeon]|nr:ribonuclease HI [Candidatus Nanoarchaeia archaeon]
MNSIIIFTDGASRGNPGPGGWAAVIVEGEEVTELGGAERETTNNRMELTAVIEAIAFLEIETSDVDSIPQPINIYTDSSYVLNGAKSWLKGWLKNDWKTKTKDDVSNKDLWQRMAIVMEGKEIAWHLVKGHVGIVGNDQCDKIATAFADGKNPKLYRGLLKDYGHDVLNISHNPEAHEKRSASKSRSRAAAFSYVSKVDGKIEIHKTWAETEKRVRGAKGALYKKALSPEEEAEIVKDFNSR